LFGSRIGRPWARGEAKQTNQDGRKLIPFGVIAERCPKAVEDWNDTCGAIGQAVAFRSRLEARSSPDAAKNMEPAERCGNTVRGRAHRHKNGIGQAAVTGKRKKTLNGKLKIGYAIPGRTAYASTLADAGAAAAAEEAFTSGLNAVEAGYLLPSLADRFSGNRHYYEYDTIMKAVLENFSLNRQQAFSRPIWRTANTAGRPVRRPGLLRCDEKIPEESTRCLIKKLKGACLGKKLKNGEVILRKRQLSERNARYRKLYEPLYKNPSFEALTREQSDAVFGEFAAAAARGPKLETRKGFTRSAAAELLKAHLPGFVRKTEEPSKDLLPASADEREISKFFSECVIYAGKEETFFIECKKEDAVWAMTITAARSAARHGKCCAP
jgi:hypothetical protein